MTEVAVFFRLMQLYAHIAHHLVDNSLVETPSGHTHGEFFSDHKYLGKLYLTYETAYDSIVERMLGLGEPIDLFRVQEQAVRGLAQFTFESNQQAFETILAMEKRLVVLLTKHDQTASIGTKALLEEAANQSEVRQYKLSRRVRVGRNASIGRG